MVKSPVVLALLSSLDEKITLLRSLQPLGVRELANDPLRWYGLLHLLQLSIGHVTGICAQLLVGTNPGPVDDSRQLLLNAGRSGILPIDFAERITSMIVFRNMVVHEYLSVDPAKVDDMLLNRLDDFEEFKMHVYDYLRREGHLPPVEPTV